MIRILVVDDHDIVHRGLRQIVAEQPDMTVTGEAHNCQEALALTQAHRFDAVVLDISLPGRGGLEVLKEVKEAQPRLPVLILSMHPEEQYAIRALRLGAAGYMTKESAPAELIAAIRRIVAGGRYVSASLAETLAGSVVALDRPSDRPLHETLSDREYLVMRLIASGKTATEIADELALSIKTITTYRARTLAKMGMRNNAELMQYALRNKLVD